MPDNFTVNSTTTGVKCRLPHIENLPLELLLQIFVYCTSDDALAPPTLASVSKLWKQVVSLSPRVWQFIALDDKSHPVGHSLVQVELWLRLSAPLPFDVQLSVENPDLILPLLSPLLPAIDRCRNLTITGKREESVNFCTPFIALERLTINICDPEEEPWASIPKSTFPSAPLQWTTHAIAMHVWLSALPVPDLLTPLRFTNIFMCSQLLHTQPNVILSFLSACPKLQVFHYIGWARRDRLLTGSLPIVSLPHLHTLRLVYTCSARAILSSIHSPTLKELYLSSLNVRFDLQDEHHEEGDSEDDTGDFSQWPSSAHATGMGLRNLIARSHPPIRVLKLAKSDIRTKDFRYLLDKLVMLEDLNIGISDMSDNVVNLLRPFSRLDEEGPLHIRLPRLQKLELFKCQRFSGDVAVDAITARVNFTDNVAPCFTLTELAILDCWDFTDRHAQVLLKKLGTRLRYTSNRSYYANPTAV